MFNTNIKTIIYWTLVQGFHIVCTLKSASGYYPLHTFTSKGSKWCELSSVDFRITNGKMKCVRFWPYVITTYFLYLDSIDRRLGLPLLNKQLIYPLGILYIFRYDSCSLLYICIIKSINLCVRILLVIRSWNYFNLVLN